jgi:cellulose synthase/poly-beta-1,6-N-acetylglucosamine synthase-like glycosyltransferase
VKAGTTFAIIIACRNEEKYIGRCLDSILALQYDRSLLQVFVCDGSSTDRTPEIVKEYETEYPFIKLLHNHRQTTPFAFNLGITSSTADLVMSLGAHAELFPDYLENCLRAFERDPAIGCVGGYAINVMEDETSAIIAAAMSSAFGVGNAYFRTGGKEGYVDTVGIGTYKREVFARVGMYDEELARNQDDEFNFRVIMAGYKIYLDLRLKTKYYVRASFEKLYRQYYQYGYWKVYVNKKHRTVTTARQLVPLFFVLFLTLGLLISLFHIQLFVTWLVVLLMYLAGGAYAAARAGKKPSHIPKIIFTFFILHWSYGSGYLKGMVDFLILGLKPGQKAAALTR